MLILNAFILLGVNAYYVMINIPPDGRWKFQIPITSLFIFVYLVLFFVANKKLLKNTVNYFFMIVFNIVLSIVFLSFAKKIEIIFQDVNLLYLKYIPVVSYIIIFGIGIISYILMSIFLKKEAINKKVR